MTHPSRRSLTLLGLAAAVTPPVAGAAEPVDMLLVLAADVSRSVTESKFKLQREGAAAAITHPDVVRAITSGPHRRIAVCFLEWATAGQHAVVIDWVAIDGEAAARRFGDRLVEMPRSFSGSTSISSAIDFSVAQLERAPFVAERRVIDISGDGVNNSGRPVTIARDEAVGQGVVINGLPVINDRPDPFPMRQPPLDEYYREQVIGGAGSFVEVASGFEAFDAAVRRKLLREIAGLAPQGPIAG